jgi:5-methyltetrahydrofolate--homocysteine methyltransferase
MKKAVAYLLPFMEEEQRRAGEAHRSQGKILLATVKGDVHDIGKNIVSVVLGCNNYEVVDLGVMVPCDRILQAAIDTRADVIGLSGLITPSLDEMVFVAREMERRGFSLPLLIGGATTSRQHTAVKIAPEYHQPTVYVPDASRVVDVAASLLNPKLKAPFAQATRDEQAELRDRYAARQQKALLPYHAAAANRLELAFDREALPIPAFTGSRLLNDVPLAELVPYIDWTFFFAAWEIKGRFPAVLNDPKVGRAARELYENGTALLSRIVDDQLLAARGVYGFWPAESDGDDIVLFTDQARRGELLRFNMLRQQEILPDRQPNRSLADYVAPGASGLPDHLGAFAVTAGHGVDDLVRRFEQDHDEYQAILVKALADRLAEAFAAYLHARARREWGLAEPSLGPDAVIAEQHRGIRPAFGYPACPDHSEKRKLFALLDPWRIGLSLTETGAMVPAASVAGLYFAHPEARYFVVGRIGRDQAEDYARRKAMPLSDVERWLGPYLAYEPEPVRP